MSDLLNSIPRRPRVLSALFCSPIGEYENHQIYQASREPSRLQASGLGHGPCQQQSPAPAAPPHSTIIMPRTALPPTPASSTDIHGKDGTKQLSSLQMSFELPEPAINNPNSAGPSHSTAGFRTESPVSTTSPKTPYPIQPAEAVKSRRRSSAAVAATKENNAFALPPPPTRSRKIIQMKPRLQQDEKKQPVAEQPAPTPAATTGGKGAGRRTAAATAVATATAAAPAASDAGPASKKKQPSATSAAGRKIARKTAHSLIERRRRSKMNEEFAVLKGMIPACTGEMHKLAILQVSH